jgi:HSP20 family protein
MFMTRRNPFWDMEQMVDQMQRAFDVFGGPLGLRSVPSGVFPALNVYDAKDKLVVTAEIPGVDPTKLELTALENSLTLSGTRPSEQIANAKQAYRQERPAGDFKRTLTLSEKVDPAGITATYKHGILKIELPKAKVTQARTIAIKSESEN